jgi:prolyl oligopeptidase PreP (S9A serine peptidase family)
MMGGCDIDELADASSILAIWRCYDRLPMIIQQQADKAYQRWQDNPHALGLFFKRVSKTRPVYSVRINDDCRALGLLEGDTVTWFWIGTHDEYMRILKNG